MISAIVPEPRSFPSDKVYEREMDPPDNKVFYFESVPQDAYSIFNGVTPQKIFDTSMYIFRLFRITSNILNNESIKNLYDIAYKTKFKYLISIESNGDNPIDDFISRTGFNIKNKQLFGSYAIVILNNSQIVVLSNDKDRLNKLINKLN